MFLGYPNTGKVDTYLIEKSCHRSIIRNAACGNNSALVKAVYKDCTLKEFVLVELINELINNHVSYPFQMGNCSFFISNRNEIEGDVFFVWGHINNDRLVHATSLYQFGSLSHLDTCC